MPGYSHSELNSIREVVSSHQTTANKLNDYANQCQDQNIKQMFTTAAQDAAKSAQNLIQML
ncbi:MAG: hypothetical protein LBB94_09860 [Clostridiales bacterium]|jgi:phosphoribosylcarboxyaminoimidazole (NCAIR) mutase|nr:hypothetical protein [Clostridiales bacterium]